jgi:hypothetical protein
LLEQQEQIILVVAVVLEEHKVDSGANGGSGVVILRMADTNYSGTTTGSPTVNTNVGGTGETVLIFNAFRKLYRIGDLYGTFCKIRNRKHS